MFARRLLAAARPSAAWRTPSSSPSMTMMMAMAMSSTTTRTVSRTAVPVVEQSALFAVVHVSGHQYKVSVGDVITTQRIRDANVGDDFKCDKVLAIGGGESSLRFGLYLVYSICCCCCSQFYHSRHAIGTGCARHLVDRRANQRRQGKSKQRKKRKKITNAIQKLDYCV
jgi:hypothetical protein